MERIGGGGREDPSSPLGSRKSEVCSKQKNCRRSHGGGGGFPSSLGIKSHSKWL